MKATPNISEPVNLKGWGQKMKDVHYMATMSNKVEYNLKNYIK